MDRLPLLCVVCFVASVGCGQAPAPVARVSIAPSPASQTTGPTEHTNATDDDGVLCIRCRIERARTDSTRNNLKALHAVAEMWRASHGDECPSVQRLKDDKDLAESSDLNDAWGSPYKIMCDDQSTTVSSFGPDRKEGTRDDIRFPQATPNR